MKVLGIDPGLVKTTVAVVWTEPSSTKSSPGVRFRIEELIPEKENSKGVLRLAYYDAAFQNLFSKYGSRYVFMEGYSFGVVAGKGKGRAFDLGELGGIIKYNAWNLLIKHPMILIPPGVWKKCVTGNGRASKALVASVLAKKYNCTFESQDSADALGIALTGLYMLTNKNKKAKDIRLKTERLW